MMSDDFGPCQPAPPPTRQDPAVFAPEAAGLPGFDLPRPDPEALRRSAKIADEQLRQYEAHRATDREALARVRVLWASPDCAGHTRAAPVSPGRRPRPKASPPGLHGGADVPFDVLACDLLIALCVLAGLIGLVLFFWS